MGGGWAALGAARVLALAACALDPGARAAAKLEAHDHHVKVVEVAHRAALADAARFGDRGLVGEARARSRRHTSGARWLAARATFERASDAPPWASLREALGRCAVLATRISPLLDALDRRSADARRRPPWRAAAASRRPRPSTGRTLRLDWTSWSPSARRCARAASACCCV